ncbi:3591_t:CDS:2 [Paraglomus brasilianum]|uniref:3591_t:CDS:1 n=1 Tax=Paraglomus brasilianum TaxID=144538 RepID=A0A9N9F5Y5_9GLOM|nr:3591_t:CDS:2 [Paraglomus brasilianum]
MSTRGNPRTPRRGGNSQRGRSNSPSNSANAEASPPASSSNLSPLTAGRRLGSLHNTVEAPAPGRLASLRLRDVTFGGDGSQLSGMGMLSSNTGFGGDVTLGGFKKMTFRPSVPPRRKKTTITAPGDGDSKAETAESFSVDMPSEAIVVKDESSATEAHVSNTGTTAQTASSRPNQRSRLRNQVLTASGPFAYGPSAMSSHAIEVDGESVTRTGSRLFSDNRLKSDVVIAENLAFSFCEDPWAPVTLFEAPDQAETLNSLENNDTSASLAEQQMERVEPFTFNEEDNHLFLFQLPPILPEFESDDKADNQQKDSKGTRHLEGMVGKLVVYKSVETKLKLGNIELDVYSGTECSFLQNIMVLDPTKKGAYCLGQVSKQFVCVPDIETLLDHSDEDNGRSSDDV